MILGIFKIIGIILFLYLTWRNLRDNYQDEKLVAYSWLMLVMFLLGGRVLFGFINWGIWNSHPLDWLWVWEKPGFNYWGGIVLVLLTTWWYCVANGWKVWAFFEDITGLIYVLVSLLLIEEIVKNGLNVRLVAYLGAVVIGYVLSKLVGKKYRSMVWYKSGKKGFVFFFSNMIVCLLAAVIGLLFGQSPMVVVAFSVLSLLFMIGLFILGEVFNSLLVQSQRR